MSVTGFNGWIVRFVRWCLFQRQPNGQYIARPTRLFRSGQL